MHDTEKIITKIFEIFRRTFTTIAKNYKSIFRMIFKIFHYLKLSKILTNIIEWKKFVQI